MSQGPEFTRIAVKEFFDGAARAAVVVAFIGSLGMVVDRWREEESAFTTEVRPPQAFFFPKENPTISLEIGVGIESDVEESLGAILRRFNLEKFSISKKDFEAKNPGCWLLVPENDEGQILSEQNTLAFSDQTGKTWVLGNFNMPKPKGPQLPIFNTSDFGNFLMGKWDNQDRYYHVPLSEGKEGKDLAVYYQDEEFKQGWVDKETGRITESQLYWQKMPEEAAWALMVEDKNAVYLVFFDRDNKLIEDQKIKLFNLPPDILGI